MRSHETSIVVIATDGCSSDAIKSVSSHRAVDSGMSLGSKMFLLFTTVLAATSELVDEPTEDVAKAVATIKFLDSFHWMSDPKRNAARAARKIIISCSVWMLGRGADS